jgi:hypothetical protein
MDKFIGYGVIAGVAILIAYGLITLRQEAQEEKERNRYAMYSHELTLDQLQAAEIIRRKLIKQTSPLYDETIARVETERRLALGKFNYHGDVLKLLREPEFKTEIDKAEGTYCSKAVNAKNDRCAVRAAKLLLTDAGMLQLMEEQKAGKVIDKAEKQFCSDAANLKFDRCDFYRRNRELKNEKNK